MARNQAVPDQEMAVRLLQTHNFTRSQYIGGISRHVGCRSVKTTTREDHPSSSLIVMANFLGVSQCQLRNGILSTVIGQKKIYVAALYALAATGADDGIIDFGIVGSEGRCKAGALRYECRNEFLQPGPRLIECKFCCIASWGFIDRHDQIEMYEMGFGHLLGTYYFYETSVLEEVDRQSKLYYINICAIVALSSFSSLS